MGDVWGLLVDPVLRGVSVGPPDPAESAGDRVDAMVSLPRREKGAWPSASSWKIAASSARGRVLGHVWNWIQALVGLITSWIVGNYPIKF